nr:lisH domain-containing protein C1711.05-like [Tanacetum cinerariifolium]
MEIHNTSILVSFFVVLLFRSIPVSLSEPANSKKTNQYATSSNPPVLIPRLETWARAMQLSFRSITEPPIRSQLPSHSSRMISIPYQETSEIESELNTPFLDGNSNVLEMTMRSIEWLIKLGSNQAQRLLNTLGNPKDEAKILKVCKDSYENAYSNLQEALEALSSKNIKRMNSLLNAVLSDVGDCRDEYSGKRSPLAIYEDQEREIETKKIPIKPDIMVS